MNEQRKDPRSRRVQIERKLCAVLPLRGGRYKLDGLLVAARRCPFTTLKNFMRFPLWFLAFDGIYDRHKQLTSGKATKAENNIKYRLIKTTICFSFSLRNKFVQQLLLELDRKVILCSDDGNTAVWCVNGDNKKAQKVVWLAFLLSLLVAWRAQL